MSDEEIKKQPAVDETKVSAQPDTAVDGAQKDQDLDALLATYEEGTRPVSPPEPKVETPSNEQAVPVWVKNLEQRYIKEEVNKVGEEVFDGLEVPERLKTAWLDQIAREKPAVAKAFINRESDPTSWKKIIPGLKLEARKDFPTAVKVDPEATADRNAVAAAVRGASTKVTAEPPPNLGRMSNADFLNWTRENYGF